MSSLQLTFCRSDIRPPTAALTVLLVRFDVVGKKAPSGRESRDGCNCRTVAVVVALTVKWKRVVVVVVKLEPTTVLVAKVSIFNFLVLFTA